MGGFAVGRRRRVDGITPSDTIMHMKIIDSGTVAASRPKTDAVSCCFPNVCALESGRWIAGFRLGPAKTSRTQRAFLRFSDDQGKSWSDLIEPLPSAPQLNGRQGSWRGIALTPLGGKRVAATLCWEDTSQFLLPMFNEQTEGIFDMKLFTAISDDAGKTFGPPRLVDAGKYRDVPTPLTGAMLLLPDGRWGAQFEVNQHYNDPTPWQHASAMVFSNDNGSTWGDTVDIHTDPQRRMYCWDQRVARAGDKVVALFWTFDRVANAYLNIHARTSRDSGRTWGDLTDTGVPGQPARLASIDAKTSVMVYVDRTGVPAVKARLSGDGGKTFPTSTELLIHDRPLKTQTWNKGSMQDAWAEMSEFSIGLPDAVTLGNGDVLAVYYTGPRADVTDIAWTRLRV